MSTADAADPFYGTLTPPKSGGQSFHTSIILLSLYIGMRTEQDDGMCLGKKQVLAENALLLAGISSLPILGSFIHSFIHVCFAP